MLKKLLFLICLSPASVAEAQNIFIADIRPGKAVAFAGLNRAVYELATQTRVRFINL